MSPLREFCPKCGASTDPHTSERLRGRRRERPSTVPGGRPDDELKQNRKTVLMVAGGLLLFLGVAGKLSWPHVPIHIHTHDHASGPVVIGAEQIYDAYRDDPDAAAKRFRDREMVVSGEFVRIVPDGYGSIDMRLKTSNPESPLGVDLAQISVEPAAHLRPGQQVTVSCHRITGSGDDRWLQDCAIQAPQDASAPPDQPAPPAPPTPPPAPRS